MPTVRTTMQPDVELDVSDAEYTDLQRQGLLVGDEEQADTETPAASTAPPAPTPAAAPAKTLGPVKSKEN